MDSISYSLGIVLAANLKNQGFSDINTEELAQGFAEFKYVDFWNFHQLYDIYNKNRQNFLKL